VLKWRAYWEPIRNLEETPWEHIGKHEKMIFKKILPTPLPPPKLERNKSKAPWPFPLAERETSWSLLGLGVELGLTPSFIDYILLFLILSIK